MIKLRLLSAADALWCRRRQTLRPARRTLSSPELTFDHAVQAAAPRRCPLHVGHPPGTKRRLKQLACGTATRGVCRRARDDADGSRNGRGGRARRIPAPPGRATGAAGGSGRRLAGCWLAICCARLEGGPKPARFGGTVTSLDSTGAQHTPTLAMHPSADPRLRWCFAACLPCHPGGREEGRHLRRGAVLHPRGEDVVRQR
eukprot:COSAG06_NODE_25_length_32611_cov_10.451160_2_plen_201_part_00